jgi:hypothetical protein
MLLALQKRGAFSFLAELPLFENSRNIEMSADPDTSLPGRF